MRLNLCIDIDGTITYPYYWVKYVNKYFNLNIKPQDVDKYHIPDIINVSEEEYNKFYSECCYDIHWYEELREGAHEILRLLNKKHNIYYVTARDKKIEQLTKKWIHKNGLPKSKLYVLGSHYKVETAKRLNCHIFMEDRYENAIELAKSGFKVLLLDTNYNKGSIEGYDIIRLNNWNEVYEEVLKYENMMEQKSAIRDNLNASS